MEKPGQIQRLMDAATRSLNGVKRGLGVDARKQRVVRTLARYGIFTESTVQECTVDTGESAESKGEQKVYVAVDVRFTAPDGSFETVRMVGEGSGEFMNATTDAAEQAEWMAISGCLAVDLSDEAIC